MVYVTLHIYCIWTMEVDFVTDTSLVQGVVCSKEFYRSIFDLSSSSFISRAKNSCIFIPITSVCCANAFLGSQLPSDGGQTNGIGPFQDHKHKISNRLKRYKALES